MPEKQPWDIIVDRFCSAQKVLQTKLFNTLELSNSTIQLHIVHAFHIFCNHTLIHCSKKQIYHFSQHTSPADYILL